MTALVRYEAARAALQAAHDVDEVKDIRDKAQAMAAYAKQANDTAMVEWATEIKVRAERKAGEMLAEMDKNKGAAATRSRDGSALPTLEKLGISHNQSSRWQKLAAIPPSQFEQAVEAAKEIAGEVTTAALLRASRPVDDPPASPPVPKPKVIVADRKFEKLYEQVKAELIETKEALADSEEKREAAADAARDLEDKLTAFEKVEPDEQQKEIMRLQKRVVKLEGEVEHQKRRANDLQAKCNELIREVKRLRKHG